MFDECQGPHRANASGRFTADDAWWAYGAGVATLDVSRHTAEFLARLLAVHQRRLRIP
ncbi:hypothetical protein ABZT43_47580 [Streptomyces sp. NPDC005349]|uniref:hypothetical protein n=1 Tax=Streptomyces sp. NPDC005349 TaxID=3157037 RepID=UPI0033A3EE0A